jgi:hypothetical protein
LASSMLAEVFEKVSILIEPCVEPGEIGWLEG